jgi:hypothetical protein
MNKYKTFVVTTVYLFVLNLIFSFLIYKYLLLSNVLFYLLESISVSSIICLISSFFKEKVKK